MSKHDQIKYQAVFFDFDGVILDSVDVKTRAFAEMFRPFGPEVEKAIVDYHLANGGLSRFKKFEYIYEHVLKKPVSKEELEILGQEFTELALKGVLESPFIPGALETLRKLKEKKIPAFVVSGTPNDELKYIIQKRDLKNFFKEVRGSPKNKVEIVTELLYRFDYKAEYCIFFGDAISDYNVANYLSLLFVGIVANSDKNIFPKGTIVFNDFLELIKASRKRNFIFGKNKYPN